jgi:L-amino acid N-acyltransferase YncA
MFTIRERASTDDSRLGRPPDHLRLNIDLLLRDRPAAHFEASDDVTIYARCSIWNKGTPEYQRHRLGVIGHYAAEDQAAGQMVLDHACRKLGNSGCSYVVGPMDGNTWRRYRLVTESGDEPPFFLEPQNPPEWPAHFIAAGFSTISTYSSGMNSDLGVTDPRTDQHLERLAQAGVTLRSIDLPRFEEELAKVHRLSLESFSENFLYTPIEPAEFMQMYSAVRPHIRPEFVIFAEQGNQLIGFLFAIPDLNQAARGQKIDTLIAKTIAVRPGRAGAGLGSVLLDLLQRKAQAAGFKRVIYALMHDENTSTRIAARYCTTMRRYALYGKALLQ